MTLAYFPDLALEMGSVHCCFTSLSSSETQDFLHEFSAITPFFLLNISKFELDHFSL